MGLNEEHSALVGREVEFAITRAGLRVLTPGLVRELTLAVLAERGVADALLRARARIGMSVMDAERLIRGENKRGGAPAPATATRAGEESRQNPTLSDRAIAAIIKREYALQAIFSDGVSAAHMAGEIHLENLGEPDRLYSLILPADLGGETTRENGGDQGHERALNRLGAETRVLTAQLSGELVWDAFNWDCAAWLMKESTSERYADDAQLKDYAARICGILTQSSHDTGCRKIALHLDWDAPAHLSQAGIDYANDDAALAATARKIMQNLLHAFPSAATTATNAPSLELIVHITTRWAASHDYHQTLEAVTQAAAEGKALRIALDRDDQDQFFARYGLNWRRGMQTPRAFCFGRVAINLVRLAKDAAGDETAYFEALADRLELAAQAHLEKRVFLEKLLALGDRGPLARLARRDQGETRGKPFLRLDRATHLLCPIGLSEAARAFIPEDETSTRAADLAARTLAVMLDEAAQLSAQHKIRLLVAPSRSRNAPSRLARIDRRRENRNSARSSQSYSADISVMPLQERNAETLFAKIESDAALHLQNFYEPAASLDVRDYDPKQLAVLISRAFYQTDAVALLFNKEPHRI